MLPTGGYVGARWGQLSVTAAEGGVSTERLRGVCYCTVSRGGGISTTVAAAPHWVLYGHLRSLFAVPMGRPFPNPLKFGPKESYSSATSFRGTPNWPGMSLQLPCHQVVPGAVAPGISCIPALFPASPAEVGPACIPPAPAEPCPTSALWPKSCCSPKAVPCPWKQKGSLLG